VIIMELTVTVDCGGSKEEVDKSEKQQNGRLAWQAWLP
jgi:hypothetical protein